MKRLMQRQGILITLQQPFCNGTVKNFQLFP